MAKKGHIPWNKNRKCPEISLGLKGRHHSEEIKRKLRIALQGNKNFLGKKHFNGIKSDNRIKNLIVFVNDSVHQKFERGKLIRPTEIIFDGRKL